MFQNFHSEQKTVGQAQGGSNHKNLWPESTRLETNFLGFFRIKSALKAVVFAFFSKSIFLFCEESVVKNHLKNFDLLEKSTNLEFVDCIYVINLDERPEKWEKVKKKCQEQGIAINRVSAINGWKIPLEDQKKLQGRKTFQLSGGQLGCFLSHLSVIQDAYTRGFNLVWIMEDDIEFVGLPQNLSGLLSRLSKVDPDWDFFFTDLDSICFFDLKNFLIDSDQKTLSSHYYKRRILFGDEIMRIRGRYGLYSYFISRKGMEKVLDYFFSNPLFFPIDHQVHFIPGIREYSTTREIVTVENLDISDTNHNPKEASEKSFFCSLGDLQKTKNLTKEIKLRAIAVLCLVFCFGFFNSYIKK